MKFCPLFSQRKLIAPNQGLVYNSISCVTGTIILNGSSYLTKVKSLRSLFFEAHEENTEMVDHLDGWGFWIFDPKQTNLKYMHIPRILCIERVKVRKEL